MNIKDCIAIFQLDASQEVMVKDKIFQLDASQEVMVKDKIFKYSLP